MSPNGIDHDTITELKTDMKYVVKKVDCIDKKLDSKISYKTAGLVLAAIGAVLALLKYGIAIAALL